MLIENAVDLLLLRRFELFEVRRSTVGKPASGGAFFLLPAIGPLARGSEVDQVCHSRPVGSTIRGPASRPCIAGKCAVSLAVYRFSFAGKTGIVLV